MLTVEYIKWQVSLSYLHIKKDNSTFYKVRILKLDKKKTDNNK